MNSANPTSDSLLKAALHDPVEQFLDGGGKRIRGAMTQIAFEMAGGRGEISPSISTAIEFLHAGSLVIDDIQDDSHTRRGRPTMHTQIGKSLAINAGNWMYFRALETLSDAPFQCEVRSAMTTAMIRSGRVCHEGQALDLAARVDQLEPSDYAAVAKQISEQKTGELVRLAMTLGGLAGNASKSLIGAMDRFGNRVGVALQMRNDLDELASLANASDEVRDDDLRNARVTWSWAWLASADESLARQLSRCRIVSRDQAVQVARSLLPRVASIGDAAIGQRLDREIRLLGEHVLERKTFDLIEKVLQPIRNCKTPTTLSPTTPSREQELSDVCHG